MTDEERNQEGGEETIEDLEAPAEAQGDVAGGQICGAKSCGNPSMICVDTCPGPHIHQVLGPEQDDRSLRSAVGESLKPRPVVRGVVHADFVVLRAPLLAVETLSRWAEGVGAPAACAENDERLEQALEADRALLRARLAELAADDQVADGLELTSPDLVDALAGWRSDPDSKDGRSAERALVRYVTRLASRPDLFGLAGAYTLGGFAEQARLELAPRSQLDVLARVDSNVLRDVVREAAAQASGDPALIVRRNPGAYRVGGRWRVAAREHCSSAHRLVEIRSTPAIEPALEGAAEGVSMGELAARLEAGGSRRTTRQRLLRRLLRALLVPVADVAVTGAEPTAQALEALSPCRAPRSTPRPSSARRRRRGNLASRSCRDRRRHAGVRYGGLRGRAPARPSGRRPPTR